MSTIPNFVENIKDLSENDTRQQECHARRLKVKTEKIQRICKSWIDKFKDYTKTVRVQGGYIRPLIRQKQMTGDDWIEKAGKIQQDFFWAIHT